MASLHHSEHSVLGADIYVHEAKALVVAVLVFVSLGQLSEVALIQCPAMGGKGGQTIRKQKPSTGIHYSASLPRC